MRMASAVRIFLFLGGEIKMACYHIKYEGGNSNAYRCDLCNKYWDWGAAEVETKCKKGEEYRNCPIWKKYS